MAAMTSHGNYSRVAFISLGAYDCAATVHHLIEETRYIEFCFDAIYIYIIKCLDAVYF